MAITVRFACGHQTRVSEATTASAPQCHCGETRVQHVSVRAPRFRGACHGPYCETTAADPITVALTSTPLVLRAAKE